MEKRQDEAKTLFREALDHAPGFIPALNRLVKILVFEGKADEAVKICKREIARSKPSPGLYLILGNVYYFKKDRDGAIKSLEKALELNPVNGTIINAIARTEKNIGSIDTAIKRYEKRRKQDPGNVGYLLLLATLCEEKGDHAMSAKYYMDALDINPNLPVAANNLAFYYAEYEPTKKNLKKARELMEPLFSKYKGNPNFMDTMAWIDYRMGEYRTAWDRLASIEKLKKRSPVINYHLAMIYYRLGKIDRAKKYLHMAMDSGTDFPGKGNAARMLKEWN